MSVSRTQEKLLTGAYAAVRRSGILRTALGSRIFSHSYFLYKRYLEDNLFALLQRHPGLVRGGNVFDVGANLGYTASVFAAAADPDCFVFAFEPEPFNVSMLQRAVARPRRGASIVPVASAVGASRGTVPLWLNERHHADHRVVTESFRGTSATGLTIDVPVTTLDAFLEEHPGPVSFVKIDVQGYELAVCQGMQQLLNKNPGTAVLIEYMPSALKALGFAPEDLLHFFASRGYRSDTVQRGGILIPGTPSLPGANSYCDVLFRRQPVTAGGAV